MASRIYVNQIASPVWLWPLHRRPNFTSTYRTSRTFVWSSSAQGPSLHLPCNTWNLFISLKFSFTKNVAQNKVTVCLYSAVNIHNDSCEPRSQIQGRMMFYSKCWECGSWSLLGTICSWWLTIMGKWFYCFHIRQEKWYLCMSPKKGCCWASSSSLVMYLLRMILAYAQS